MLVPGERLCSYIFPFCPSLFPSRNLAFLTMGHWGAFRRSLVPRYSAALGCARPRDGGTLQGRWGQLRLGAGCPGALSLRWSRPIL